MKKRVAIPLVIIAFVVGYTVHSPPDWLYDLFEGELFQKAPPHKFEINEELDNFISSSSQQTVPDFFNEEGIGVTGESRLTEPSNQTSYGEYSCEYFSIRIPNDWKFKQDDHVVSCTFYSPKTSSTDKFIENIQVDVEQAPNDFVEYLEHDKQEMLDLGVMLLSDDQTDVNGNIAYIRLWTARINEDEPRIVSLIATFIKNNLLYTITCTGSHPDFEQYADIFGGSVFSFEIK